MNKIEIHQELEVKKPFTWWVPAKVN